MFSGAACRPVFLMILGYNTNGLAHHDAPSAVRLLAQIGYRSVAITIDHGMLNPQSEQFDEEVAEMRRLLDELGMRSVVETGARFLLDPNVKHEPTLMTADASGRAQRVEFLKHAIDIAATLGSDCVSFWSGVLRAGVDSRKPTLEEGFERLTHGLTEVIGYAEGRNVVLGFEPEPGMFIDTVAQYESLLERIDAPRFQLTLDVGHLHCLGEVPIDSVVRCWKNRIVNVHVEDMCAGVHEHRMFGEGEIDFPPVIAAFREIGYAGPLHVELSRHSHEGPAAAREAFEFLKPLCENG